MNTNKHNFLPWLLWADEKRIFIMPNCLSLNRLPFNITTMSLDKVALVVILTLLANSRDIL
jgi:hypothetical protein